MSERRHGPGEGKLPLPSPRSPRQLDDRILAYARDNAPEKKSFGHPRWVAGLATASVVVLALFITEPQQQTPNFNTPAPKLEEDLSPRAARTETLKEKTTAPAARMKMSPGTGQAAPIDKYEMLADEPLFEQEITADAITAGVKTDEDMSNRAIQPLKLSATATELTILNSEELRDKLQLYADMVEKGEGEQARAAYQQLRQTCPDCALPDTLAQALTTLLEAESPVISEQ
jgi:hypothetical protein